MTKNEIEEEAARLIASGYCPTSNRYRMVSRLDRADWREVMADFQTGGFPGDKEKNRADGMRWVTNLGPGAADFYRRVLSKDKLDGVHPEVFRRVKAARGTHGWGGVSEFMILTKPGFV